MMIFIQFSQQAWSDLYVREKSNVIYLQSYVCWLESRVLRTIKDCGSKTATLKVTNFEILNKYDIPREDALEQVSRFCLMLCQIRSNVGFEMVDELSRFFREDFLQLRMF